MMVESSQDLDKTTGDISVDNTDVDSLAWARLMSLNPEFPHISLEDDECSFGRGSQHKVVIQDKKISLNHCKIYRKQVDGDFKIFLEDYSSNGTFVNSKRVGKGNTITLVHGNEISLTSIVDLNNQSRIVYVLHDLEKLRRDAEEERARLEREEEERRKVEDQEEGHTQIIDDISMSDLPVTPIKSNSNINTVTTPVTPLVKDSTTLVTSGSNLMSIKKSSSKGSFKQQQQLNTSTSSATDNSVDKTPVSTPTKRQSSGNIVSSPSTSTTSTSTTTTTAAPDSKRKRDDEMDDTSTSTSTSTTSTTNTSVVIDQVKKAQKIDHDTMEDNLMCGICQEIIHKCITLIPCMHNFCACCYGDWRANSSDCPQCRTPVKSGQKNHAINNLIESYLQKNTEKRRDPEELKDMDQRSKITDEMLTKGVLNKSNGKYYNDDEDEDDEYDEEEDEEEDDKCVNCTTPASDGFKCPPNAMHRTCSACYELFPSRTPNIYPDQCEFCMRHFCQKCYNNGHLRRLADINAGGVVPRNTFSGNQFEIKILTDYLQEKNKMVQQLYTEVITQIDQGIIKNADIQPLAPGRPEIKGERITCDHCAKNIFAQALFAYRKNLPKDQLPAYAHARDKCYYGKNCRTQFNKFDHAKKFDHICDQTKF
ncbi:hypothetical protein DFA_05727 [Cavenderia fasciculata]|uniref:E3 ubiquitin-protein ligase CHFR n=1 Tax=Cavenderia fasciculata TaxID=261658 RepID=F4PM93_CACFS|nr:uncharacterized protein DFA_05727 [Cavenderia fasciculata]EGG23593.1 hypothetical protein DFA_05727 [Cavenderia fasciculata]|eukprot:XP_004361444.1 hypothetical protein DFA_05727 [Cavenderia fasciculata]